jgi:hypothetical protein
MRSLDFVSVGCSPVSWRHWVFVAVAINSNFCKIDYAMYDVHTRQAFGQACLVSHVTMDDGHTVSFSAEGLD